jgi:hypothetical protein
MGDPSIGWEDVVRFATVAGITWSAAFFLFRQQSSIKELVYNKVEELKRIFSDKLEYHERHDDMRFDNVRKDLQLLQIKIAASTGTINGDK